MANGKKSVLLYCDLIHTIEKMDDETAGLFFKHYLRYINDKNPKTDNIVVDLTFESVKQNLKRDLKKWERRAENSRVNGAKGGRPKGNPDEPKKPIRLSNNPDEPKKPVTDTVTVNVTDTVNDILLEKETKDITTSVKKVKTFSPSIYNCLDNCLKYFPEHLKPKNKNSWLDTIEKLERIDKIPLQVIEEIVKKTREDSFWGKNFLSINKLRSKDKNGVMYISVFAENIKSNNKNLNSVHNEEFQDYTAEIRRNNPNL